MKDTSIALHDAITSRSAPVLPLQIFFILLWSSGAIIITLGLRYAHPLTFLLYRMVLATFFMLLISWLTKAPWPSNWNTLNKTILVGLLTQFGYTSTYFFALYHGVSATVMTIILGLQPILTAVIYSLILKKQIRYMQYFGLFLGLIGVILTVAHDLSTHAMTALGGFYALICVASITIGSVLQKNNTGMDLRTGGVIQFGVSVIPIFILNLFFGSFVMPLAPQFLFSLSWMVLIVSVSATCLYYKLLRDGNAVIVNSLFYLVPPITAVLCYFMFDQEFNRYMVAGIGLIVLGVFITQKNNA
jgi:drug/metabolite transporter (DMT)-like permease